MDCYRDPNEVESTFTTQLVNRRISIYWDGDDVYYSATVVGYTVRTNTHLIEYDNDDGTIREEVLNTQSWKIWTGTTAQFQAYERRLNGEQTTTSSGSSGSGSGSASASSSSSASSSNNTRSQQRRANEAQLENEANLVSTRLAAQLHNQHVNDDAKAYNKQLQETTRYVANIECTMYVRSFLIPLVVVTDLQYVLCAELKNQ